MIFLLNWENYFKQNNLDFIFNSFLFTNFFIFLYTFSYVFIVKNWKTKYTNFYFILDKYQLLGFEMNAINCLGNALIISCFPNKVYKYKSLAYVNKKIINILIIIILIEE